MNWAMSVSRSVSSAAASLNPKSMIQAFWSASRNTLALRRSRWAIR